jgi:hypothetical protein
VSTSLEYWWNKPTDNPHAILAAYRKYGMMKHNYAILANDWPNINDFILAVIQWVTDGPYKGDRPLLMHALRQSLHEYKHSADLDDRQRLGKFVGSFSGLLAKDLAALHLQNDHLEWAAHSGISIADWIAAGVSEHQRVRVRVRATDPPDADVARLQSRILDSTLNSPLRERVVIPGLAPPC